MNHAAHVFLTLQEETVVMNTRRMKIRRQLRSARASALSEDERRQELRKAEAKAAQDGGRGVPGEPGVSPRTIGDGAAIPGAAETDRAGGGPD